MLAVQSFSPIQSCQSEMDRVLMQVREREVHMHREAQVQAQSQGRLEELEQQLDRVAKERAALSQEFFSLQEEVRTMLLCSEGNPLVVWVERRTSTPGS